MVREGAPHSGEDGERRWGLPWGPCPPPRPLTPFHFQSWRQMRPSSRTQVSWSECCSRQAPRARPSDSALAGKGESAPLPRISIQQTDPGWLPEFQAGPRTRLRGRGSRTPPPSPGAPHFRPKPPGLIAGTRPRVAKALGTTAVLASTAPRGPSSVVSSDCGNWGTPRRGPESLARPPRPSPSFKPGLEGGTGRTGLSPPSPP